ncbi:histidine kinase N-terminal 7TM domain-containing protein [Natrinema salinisoli]|uniref:sensor histidine kinase n=1 Tax=Natrinema salinisoli TaxID=2878535 RepID=UPI001CF065A2|nr:histidine kinase N-terminal 7TM domain-containing protein [Natrinema salinisoli]
MTWQYTPEILPYVGLLFLSMLLAGGLAVYTVVAWTDGTEEPTVRAFVGLNVGCALWSGAYAMQLLSAAVPTKLSWLAVSFVGAVLVSLSCFSFAVAYSGNEGLLSRRTLLLLVVEPVVAFVLFTTQYGNLYTRRIDTVVVSDLVMIDRTFGVMGYVHILYLYGLLALSAGFLLRTIYRSNRVYRVQAGAVLLGIFVPLVANVVWFLRLGPMGNLDFTPVAFVVSGLVYAVAISRHHLLDIVPVARTAVVENMRDGFLVIDETDRVRDVNAAVRRHVSDDDPESIVGRDIGAVFPEVTSVIRDESRPAHTEIAVDTDDQRRLFDVQVQRLSNDHRFRLLLLRDVTDQHAVEQRYQALIENASDLITVIDDENVIRYQSPSIANVLGYDPSALEGRSYDEFVHPEDRARIVDAFHDDLEEPAATGRTEYRIRDADGEWRDVETVGRNLLDDPFVDGIVLNTRDVTERKKREREIRRKNDQLGEFAGVVSHDLRNPLTVAQGYLEAAREDVDCEYHDDIELAHDRIETIIEDVLLLAREGQAIGETDRVDFERVVDRAWTHVDTGSASLTVASDRPIVADEDRILQLLENLFRNSVEHGGGDVHVRVGTVADGFFVEDDGPGIPVDERQDVLEYGHTTADSGTGFGLAIVSRIAEGHGWAVRVTEGTNGGARFEFTMDDSPVTPTLDGNAPADG